MQYDKRSPSNHYIDVDGVPTPIEDLEPTPEPVPEPEIELKSSRAAKRIDDE